ncbi:MAG: hypothetical protein AAGA29_04975 [Planctomycetota bacterium]
MTHDRKLNILARMKARHPQSRVLRKLKAPPYIDYTTQAYNRLHHIAAGLPVEPMITRHR